MKGADLDNIHKQPPPRGLQFFGRITSATTHELNNIIGIINEHAGLLEDLAIMETHKDSPVSGAEQYTQICQKISMQVHRAKAVIRSLNRFAHSVDNEVQMMDPDAMIDLILGLSGRVLGQKNVKIRFNRNENDLKITTCPFDFLNAVYSCLMFAADNVQKGNTLCIECRCTKGSQQDISIYFSGLLLKDNSSFPHTQDQLPSKLGAQIKISDDQLCLIIPGTGNKQETSG
jgi:hypothetical protein